MRKGKSKGRKPVLKEPIPFFSIVPLVKYHSTVVSALAKLFLAIEISTVHSNTISTSKQYFDILLALTIVRGLLAEIIGNEILSMASKELVLKAIEFLADRLVAI